MKLVSDQSCSNNKVFRRINVPFVFYPVEFGIGVFIEDKNQSLDPMELVAGE